MNRRVWLLCLALSAVLWGCGDDEGEQTGPPPRWRAATYNLGLAAGWVRAAFERAPLATEAVATLEADVVCVQEVWRQEHVAALQTATAGTFPNNVFLEDMPDTNPGAPACQASDLTDLQTCVEANCADVCVDELVVCVLTSCSDEYNAVPEGCQACLQAEIGQPLDDILAACTSGTTAYVYNGAFGIGVLSRDTMVSHDSLVFDATTTRRAVIYAQLDTVLGEVHAFCTHLNAVYDDVPYPKPEGSWEEEQVAQIDDLLSFIDQKSAGGQVVLMGDLNMGPAGANYIGEVAHNYQRFVDAGFVNPYTAQAGARCTFCDTNPLVSGAADDSESVVIDHILLHGVSTDVSVERILDGKVDVETCGETVNMPRSDHYGVRANFF